MYVNDELEKAFEELILQSQDQPLPVIGAAHNVILNIAILILHDAIQRGDEPIDNETVERLLERYYTKTSDAGFNKNFWVHDSTHEKYIDIAEHLQPKITTSLKAARGWNRIIITTLAVAWLYENYQQRINDWTKQHQST